MSRSRLRPGRRTTADFAQFETVFDPLEPLFVASEESVDVVNVVLNAHLSQPGRNDLLAYLADPVLHPVHAALNVPQALVDQIARDFRHHTAPAASG
jgi:hypothetical protein